jgi:hypothetical protein
MIKALNSFLPDSSATARVPFCHTILGRGMPEALQGSSAGEPIVTLICTKP